MNFATSKTSRAFRHVKYGSHTTLFYKDQTIKRAKNEPTIFDTYKLNHKKTKSKIRDI